MRCWQRLQKRSASVAGSICAGVQGTTPAAMRAADIKHAFQTTFEAPQHYINASERREEKHSLFAVLAVVCCLSIVLRSHRR